MFPRVNDTRRYGFRIHAKHERRFEIQYQSITHILRITKIPSRSAQFRHGSEKTDIVFLLTEMLKKKDHFAAQKEDTIGIRAHLLLPNVTRKLLRKHETSRKRLTLKLKSLHELLNRNYFLFQKHMFNSIKNQKMSNHATISLSSTFWKWTKLVHRKDHAEEHLYTSKLF